MKIGSFHRLTLFEDSTLPTTDEQQIFTWCVQITYFAMNILTARRKDATLREVLTTLRNTAPHVTEYRHPLARFSFRTVYADPSNKGRFAQKDLGMVYSRDILGEPGSLSGPAPRLLLDTEPAPTAPRERETLDGLRVVPGDFLLVAVLLPKNVTLPTELSIKGSAPLPQGAGWKAAGASAGGKADGGWGRAAAAPPVPGTGRGGGHWRGESNAPVRGRGGGGRGGGDAGRDGRDRDRDRDLDRDRDRIPPPRRSLSPLPRRGDGWGARGGRGGGRGGDRDRDRDRDRRTPSRSRSPPRRRGRYD